MTWPRRPRSRWAFGISVAAAFILLGAFLITTVSHKPVPEASVGAKPFPRAEQTQGHMLCIAAGGSLPFLSQAALDSEMAGIKDRAHANCVRFDIARNVVEYAPEQFDWSATDRVVRTAQQYGLQILAILDGTPNWARPSSCPVSQYAMCLPSWNSYDLFARNALARYGAMGVHYWEAWNEENTAFFSGPAASPTQYVSFLRPLYQAVHSIVPHGTLIMGGLAPSTTDGNNYSPVDFLNGIYAAGGGPWFDDLGDHPYSFPVPATYQASWNAWQQMTQLRSIMLAHGDGYKQIWITEYGAPTGGAGAEATTSNYNLHASPDHVSPELQAAILTDAVQEWLSKPWLGPMFWYSYENDVTATGNQANFGLVTAGGQAKPALAVFSQIAKRLAE